MHEGVSLSMSNLPLTVVKSRGCDGGAETGSGSAHLSWHNDIVKEYQ